MYKIYCQLRDKKGVKDAEVARNTKIAPSVFSEWKKGKSNPKQDKLQRIADYFGVSIEYLMTGEEKENYYINPETAKIAQEIFENPEMRILFDASRNANPEDLRTVTEMMLALKRKEQGGDDI